jgi:hypothetical protein
VADGFLGWPLLAHELIDNLNFGDLGEKRDPLRVMIVEDMVAGRPVCQRTAAPWRDTQVTEPAGCWTASCSSART